MNCMIHMRTFLVLIFCLCYSVDHVSSQDASPIILSIENKGITLSDYVNFVMRNDPEGTKTLKENSNDFIDYQLKLYEARMRGYDTTDLYLEDLAMYRDFLAEGYLAFDQLGDKKVEEYYTRIVKEIKISHIRVDIEGDLYRDTLSDYRQIDSLLHLIKSGENFNALAHKFSDGYSAGDSGHLGYITGMQIIFPLEELAFNTGIGEVSDIFRTSASYHLIKVHNQKDSRGSISVERIYKMAGASYSADHNRKVRQELDSLRKRIIDGEDFGSIAYRHSDFLPEEEMDIELQWIRSGGRTERFVDAAFELERDGEISPVISTNEGFYLIKRLEYKPVPPLSEAREAIYRYYRNHSPRQNYLRDKFLRNVMNTYGFTFNKDSYGRFVRYGQNSFKDGQWIEPPDLEKGRVIFTIGDRDVTFLDLSQYFSMQQFPYSFINYPPVVGQHFQKFFLEEILSYEKDHLESRYPEFNAKMKEYSDALLINSIEDEIWKNASLDSTGLINHYRKTKEMYRVSGFDGLIITFRDVKARQKLEFEINNLKLNLDELAGELQTNYGDKLETRRVLVRKGESKIIDHFIWKQSRFENEYTLIMVKGNLTKLPADNFDEVASDVLIDYQKIFKVNWIRGLRKEYSYKLMRKLINDL